MHNTASLTTATKKIAFSTIVQLFGRIGLIVISAISLKLISNFLSVHGYETYAMVVEYSLFFSVAANLGIFGNIVRLMAEAPRDGKIFANALILRMITAGAFFLVAILSLFIFDADIIFIVATILFCGSLFFDYIVSVCDGMLQANYLMGRAMFALIFGNLIDLSIIYYITTYNPIVPEGFEMALLFIAAISGSIIAAMLSLYFVRQRIKWTWDFDKQLMWNILKISIPFGLINIINSLYFRFLPDYFAQSIFAETTNGGFAMFNLSFKLSQVLGLFSTFLMFSMLPLFRQYLHEKNYKKAKTVYKRIGLLLLAAGVSMVILGSLFGPTILEFLTHKKYFMDDFWFLLPMMLTLAAISYAYDLVLISLFALDEDIWFLKQEVIALVLALTVFLCTVNFIPNIHTQAAFLIIAAITGELFIVISGLLRVRHLLKDK